MWRGRRNGPRPRLISVQGKGKLRCFNRGGCRGSDSRDNGINGSKDSGIGGSRGRGPYARSEGRAVATAGFCHWGSG